jgi:hypothetical protein
VEHAERRAATDEAEKREAGTARAPRAKK